MSETRLPSGDPLSTRTRPEEGSAGIDDAIEIRLFPDEEDTISIRLFDEDELDDPVVLLEDTDLIR